MPELATKYRFGPYEVQVRTRELYKQGQKLKLRSQAFQVLRILLEHAGDAVTREEFRQMLWPAGTFVDSEHGLNTSIKELRRVLSDSAADPHYIETLPKVGYRMMVPVEREDPAAAVPVSVEPYTPEIPASLLPEAQPKLERHRNWILYGALAIVLAALAGFWQWRRVTLRTQSDSPRLMFAVLPFENLTGDPGKEYLSDGLTEEMIAQFGRRDPQHFGVIARTSVMPYKHSQKELGQIARELDVQYILEGSVRTDSGNIRVAAQLIRVKDGARAWGKEYDRPSIHVLTMQDQIAREISDEIELTLGDHKPTVAVMRPALSREQYEAYDLYLKGLYFWNKRTVDGFWQAIKYYEQAIADDDKNAPSYAGMANSYALLGGYSGQPNPEYITRARTAALRALDIDESLPEAHAALAVIVQDYDWDWQTAEKEYRRAIELNSSYATGHHWYAEHLGFRGRFDEAFRESDRARQLDPLSLVIATDRAVMLYYSRQYDRAIQQFRAVTELDPEFPRVGVLAFPYLKKGMFAEALEATRHGSGKGPWAWSDQAYVYGRSGRLEEARHMLAMLNDFSRLHPVDPSTFVVAYLGIGDTNLSLAWLQKAYTQRSYMLTTLKVDPIFDPLRGDARFQNLVRRVGLD